METLAQDARYAVRMLLKNPGFTLVAALALALGIGANTAIFSLVNAVLLKPLPYDRPEQLVTVNHFYPNLNNLEAGFAVPSYHDIRERMRLFQSFAVMTPWNANLTEGGDPEKVIGAVATAEFFKVFRVAPLLGRTFAEGEDTDGRRHVVVLGYGLWQRRFGADPKIVGRKIVIGAEPFDVIGVMPPGFDGFFNRRTELWAPAVFKPFLYDDNHRTNEFLSAVGLIGKSKMQNRLRLIRDHVGASTAGDYTNVARGLTKFFGCRPVYRTKILQKIQELFDRRLTLLGIS